MFRTLSEDTWAKEYIPVMENGSEKMIEASSSTYSQMEEFAKKRFGDNWKLHVWTTVDADDGAIFLVNGILFVNRIAWYFTKKPFPPTETIEVPFNEEAEKVA